MPDLRRQARLRAALVAGVGWTVLGIGAVLFLGLILIAAGGWYTNVLSVAVGSGGSVTAQNPAWMRGFRDGGVVAGLDAESRAAAGRCMIVAIGRTTARRLDEVGLPPTAVAARPDVPAMIEALVEVASSRV